MKKYLTCAWSILVFNFCHSQDRFLARTYTSNVLPKGAIDFEFWHTSRMGHKDQFYHAQDQRMEIEIGLGKNWQTAFYFNRFQQRSSQTDSGTEISNEIGFSNEWKWRMADPFVKKFGVALYGEWGIKGGDEIELEHKIIIDKITGRHLFAFNAVSEFEKEFNWVDKKIIHEGKSSVEFDLAYTYNLKENLGLGIELTDYNKISKEHGWEHSVLSGGPTVNYLTTKWFVIASCLPQWTNLHRTVVAPGSRVLDEHEKTEARIIIGVSF